MATRFYGCYCFYALACAGWAYAGVRSAAPAILSMVLFPRFDTGKELTDKRVFRVLRSMCRRFACSAI